MDRGCTQTPQLDNMKLIKCKNPQRPPDSGPQAEHEMKSVPVVSLWQDVLIVNNVAESSQFSASAVVVSTWGEGGVSSGAVQVLMQLIIFNFSHIMNKMKQQFQHCQL